MPLTRWGRNGVVTMKLRVASTLRNGIPVFLAALFLFCVLGCRTTAPLPPIDLNEPGWSIETGQVLWKMNASSPEIVGELVMASNTDGRFLLQVFKDPLPLLAAQSEAGRWQLTDVPGQRTFSGRGTPPVRAMWLHVYSSIEGTPPPAPLKFQGTRAEWSLTNPISGEVISGYMNP